jgi:hypothetical protein
MPPFSFKFTNLSKVQTGPDEPGQRRDGGERDC